jgi:hypothetical protein
MGGQGRGRTAGLPLFRCDKRPVADAARAWTAADVCPWEVTVAGVAVVVAISSGI